jgi:ribonuclease HI
MKFPHSTRPGHLAFPRGIVEPRTTRTLVRLFSTHLGKYDESTMSIPRPHFLLFSDSVSESGTDPQGPHASRGAWRFVLESVDGEEKLEVEDDEPHVAGDRLDLLAVVRGLEALDQPSRVTLVTSSRYVARGFRYGLQEWRENGWQWERYGQMAPVRNGDLWQRVDRAIRYHRVDCRTMGPLKQEVGELTEPATTISSRPLDEPAQSTSDGTRRAQRRLPLGGLGRLLRPVSAALARGSTASLLPCGAK